MSEEYIQNAAVENVNLGTGRVVAGITLKGDLFYNIIKETTGFEVDSDEKLMRLLMRLSKTEKEYDRIKYALHQVRETGYGIVNPGIDELHLEEPEIIRQGGRYGVRLCASAPSIHMMRADIQTEHLIYKMKMGIKSEKKYQDFEIEYRIAV